MKKSLTLLVLIFTARGNWDTITRILYFFVIVFVPYTFNIERNALNVGFLINGRPFYVVQPHIYL